MNREVSGETVLFEPWNLGDVIIAASAWRELPDSVALGCHRQWHSLLKAALPEKSGSLIAVNLPYTRRDRTHALDFKSTTKALPTISSTSLVCSIRGDLRDYLAARKIFPGARIRMSGWVRFCARKNSLVDLPFSRGFLPIENRYRSWAELMGVSYDQLRSTYSSLRLSAPLNGRVVIHIGAQWRSKQFPHVSAVRDLLQQQEYEVVVVAGKNDKLPDDIAPDSVVRGQDESLVTLLRSAEHVITNDSGPMHLAAFLGCRTTVIARTSSIEEWLPPLAHVVAAAQTPRGYRQKKHYMSDDVLTGWPSAEKVADSLPL